MKLKNDRILEVFVTSIREFRMLIAFIYFNFRGGIVKVFIYLKYYIVKYRGRFARYVLFNIIFWAITILTPYISGKYIDILVYAKAKKIVYLYTLLILIINVLHMLISYLKDVTYTKLLNDVAFELSVQVYDHLKKIPISFYDCKESVYLSKRINDDSNCLLDFIISNSVSVFTNGLTLVIAFAILFDIDKFIALIILLTIPVYVFLYYKFKDKLYDTNYLYKEKLNSYHARIAEQFTNIGFIKINVLFNETNLKLKKSYNDLINFLMKFFKFNYFFSNTSIIILKILNVLIICYGGLKVIDRNISIGDFTIISVYFSTIITSINYFISLSSNYQQVLVSYDRMQELEREDTEPNGFVVLNSVETIGFKNISFSYNKGQYLIKNMTYTFKKGEIYCIKGANGAGKSSLLKLMIGLFSDYQGDILYNEYNLREIDCYKLRRHNIGFVMQEPSLVKGSILENIAYGIENVDITMVIYWCKKFNIYDMIDSLPQKFDTMISENASNLSGGEKQKLSIIRILLKNSPVIIFDEPTSALDYNSKALFAKNLQEIKIDKIIIIITHNSEMEEISENLITI